jgi:hypothetical protein
MMADSAWYPTEDLSQANMVAYLNDRKAKGFTAVEISLMEDESFAKYAPYDHYGNTPFSDCTLSSCSDWSTLTSAYWTNVDYFISEAKNRGMLVIAFPAYTGWCCSNGVDNWPPASDWCTAIDAQSSTVMNTFGQTLASRYAAINGFGNVVYIMGGDEGECPNDSTCVSNVAQIASGIVTGDPSALISVHWYGGTGGNPTYHSLLDSPYKNDSWATLNGIYWKTCSGAPSAVQTNFQAGASQPIFYLETCYEYQGYGGACANGDTPSTLCSEHQAMVTYLGGALVGHIYGNSNIWPFVSGTWNGPTGIGSPGSYAMGHIASLMQSREWWRLTPDYSNTVVTSNKGFGNSYKATARTSDGATVIIWNPDETNLPFTVDLTQISGSWANVWEWNPGTNAAKLIDTYETSGTRKFSPKAGTVLVIDDASMRYDSPGATGLGMASRQ